jgi:hypothetical protein
VINFGKFPDSCTVDDCVGRCRSNTPFVSQGVAAPAREEHIHIDPRCSDQAALDSLPPG